MTARRSEVRDGVLSIDGAPYYLASAEYPYFRDLPAHWEDRLRRIQGLGFRFVTLYVPWRHHEVLGPGGPWFDFAGASDDSRDVIALLQACRRIGLYAVAKPGPFIHAELDYGGLPDRVSPLQDRSIEPLRDHGGAAITWSGSGAPPEGGNGPPSWPLPAPFDPRLLAQVERWLRAVGEVVLRPHAYPAGPIVAIQLGNEGIYCDAQHLPSSSDFSAPAQERFRRFLAERECGSASAAADAGSSDHRRAWSAFQSHHLGGFLERVLEMVDVPLPSFVNVNPPVADPAGVDAWLSRVEPEAWPAISYGFTDWIGVPSEDHGVVDRYTVMVKRSRGPNLEENWGISDLYDGAYASGAVSLHQTLLAVALGATGHNVYPAVVTEHWGDGLDTWHARPYAPSSPIGADGELTERAELLALLNVFLARWGEALVASHPITDLAWGLHLPAAHAGAWRDGASREEGIGEALLGFLREARTAHLDPEIVNLATATQADLSRRRFWVVATGRRMARATQERLAEYSGTDGQLVVIGDLPTEDEAGSGCEILAAARGHLHQFPAAQSAWADVVATLLRLGLKPPISSGSRAAIWVRGDPAGDAQFVIVLTDRHHAGPVEFEVATGSRSWAGRVDLPAGSSAILRVAEGRLRGALVKGINEHLGLETTPVVRVGRDEMTASRPADLLVLAADGGWRVHAVAPPPKLAVRLPDGSTVRPHPALGLVVDVAGAAPDDQTRR